MNSEILINSAYIVASCLFIVGLKMLGRQATARKGNLISGVGMLIAIVVTLLDRHVIDFTWIIVGLVAGTVIGLACARLVKMTAMPEMVALLNGFGGLASLIVGAAEFMRIRIGEVTPAHPEFTAAAIFMAIIIGGVTFTGSMYAFCKLAEWLSGRPILFAGQHVLNGLMLLVTLVAGVAYVVSGDPSVVLIAFLAYTVLSLILGWTTVMPIGGGDMPVVISLLNSLSGLAACAAGFVISNNVLIVAGCLVGTSGVILSIIMCKAMNRSLMNVLFSGFGSKPGAAAEGSAVQGELKPISAEGAFSVLEAARQVVFIPGYGMAVSQAQHVVRELSEILEQNGAEVRFAIHPVAGRMPGHMNVLLAEADVPYEQLVEMDAINPLMPTMDVAIVIGANDVVNPAAARDKSSPIYGMPIIKAHEARTVICLKRGKGTGFSGLENQLFLLPNTRMLYGDAKSSLQAVIAEFKSLAST
ncbi:NAD(P)(+) transhydrogenase (Re/Si-specific) subunit beta [Opitutus terrae]|uniref:NAD(P) transhydrogenase subunit beta n=1 Tax=Opitutus terrae (strain DSM 11246 / JCM 15787 / PB90-1) TaxID=452637 RepID=B1ZQV1_OPITP|nr:NAD(P)(+) transhydrogenase (Re/Si-specific) subunit beta [Opitutus terrae]ACB77849.1 NAD(P)(+) transhydrogenase (AB-specific) [Opitutus terrae PB90-1]